MATGASQKFWSEDYITTFVKSKKGRSRMLVIVILSGITRGHD